MIPDFIPALQFILSFGFAVFGFTSFIMSFFSKEDRPAKMLRQKAGVAMLIAIWMQIRSLHNHLTILIN